MVVSSWLESSELEIETNEICVKFLIETHFGPQTRMVLYIFFLLFYLFFVCCLIVLCLFNLFVFLFFLLFYFLLFMFTFHVYVFILHRVRWVPREPPKGPREPKP